MSLITIEITILKSVTKVWEFFTEPDHITQWNFASDEWTCSSAQNDLQVGGVFNYRMEMKDDDFGFDYKGSYDEIIPLQKIKYHLDDGRKVEVLFEKVDENTTQVTQAFEPDPQQPELMQREGWYSILDNFHKHVENN
ncbi:SRPBCC domain-containing protein [Kaistella antarctica]|uniref:Activator of Hsp90 ATPase homolog 1-like protein n=1 Tax=Kaistella antarctica TaxID=266748 RepID=A0A448NMK2_9FLAO|nr:SRPBCC domain-containing protein [Kaistella antarctica]KEY20073.1 hypothetical protein HY04_02295 [Kaistella antarctica]SEV94049.1 Uncharacterized conserved protein YndB, AHSA1/START domain [Kaistella antarctica]VEH95452.1 Activator of Hsp90 ATPase homolog 1-like protein [Kaistella antarctica]